MLINENKVRCNQCNDIVISESENVFKPCLCGAIKITGAKKDKIRLLANDKPAISGHDYTELSTYLFND